MRGWGTLFVLVFVVGCGEVKPGDADASVGDDASTDVCAPNPCENGGTCSAGSTGPECSCADGYSGDLCQTNIDDCAPNPCQNDGTCTDAVDGYSCGCTDDYTGDQCETRVCSDTSLNYCGGECVNLLTDDRYCSDDGTCGTGCGGSDTCVNGTCASTGSTDFSFTGGLQAFTVPAGITSVDVTLTGGKGGDGWNVDSGGSVKGIGGKGGSVTATLTVTPGETLYVFVGGAGANATTVHGIGGFNGGGNGGDSPYGYSGGGGGGASDIRRGGQTLNDRVAVAGGGGSGSGWCTAGTGNGGAGGGLTGADGQLCVDTVGKGGTQAAGGATGGGFGVGGTDPATGSNAKAASAGGGGWYGGGAHNGSGGGGGSSYVVTGSTDVTHQQGVNDGNGSVTIAW